MTLSRALPWIGGLVVGAVAGALLDRITAPDPVPTGAGPAVISADGTAPIARPGTPSAAPALPGRPVQAAASAAATASALNGAMTESGPYRRRTQIMRLLAELSEDQIIACVEALRSREPTKVWTDADSVAILLERLAELNPTRALALAASKSARGFADNSVLSAVLEALAETRGDVALAWIRSLPNDRFKRGVISSWLEIVSKSDPDGALAWALTEKTPAQEFAGIFAKLAERDPAAALARAAALPAGEIRRQALGGAVGSWARTDPGGALTWVRNRPPDALRAELLSKAAGGFAEANPAAAAAFIMSSLDGRDRHDAALAVADRWVAADLPAARAWLESLPPEIARDLSPRILTVWGEKDPASAVAFAWKNGGGDGRGGWAMRSVLGDWAARDFDAAKQWLGALPPGGIRDAALQGLLADRPWGGGGASVDPRSALEIVSQLSGPMSDSRRSAMSEQMQRWARDDFEAAAVWARNLPDRKLSADLLTSALRELAGYDPQRALRTLPSLPADAIMEASRGVAATWAERDAAAAAKWVASWQPSEETLAAQREIANRWLRTDPRAAAAWLETLSPQVLAGLGPRAIGPLVSTDPATALRLVDRLPDGAQRADSFETFARAWMRLDAASAQAWIASAPQLTPDQRTRLLSGRR